MWDAARAREAANAGDDERVLERAVENDDRVAPVGAHGFFELGADVFVFERALDALQRGCYDDDCVLATDTQFSLGCAVK